MNISRRVLLGILEGIALTCAFAAGHMVAQERTDWWVFAILWLVIFVTLLSARALPEIGVRHDREDL